MVEVFKTNVRKKRESVMLLSVLSETFPAFKINFDLADCDKVLRVEGEHLETSGIVGVINEHGFMCEVLE